MYAYQDLGWGTWYSLGSGIVATAVLCLIYASMLWKRMTGKRKVPRLARRLLFAVVGGYAVYGLLYLSAANAKTPELREVYTSTRVDEAARGGEAERGTVRPVDQRQFADVPDRLHGGRLARHVGTAHGRDVPRGGRVLVLSLQGTTD